MKKSSINLPPQRQRPTVCAAGRRGNGGPRQPAFAYLRARTPRLSRGPDKILDPPEKVESPVNVAREGIVPSLRADESKLNARLRLVYQNNRAEAEVQVIGQMRRAIVVD